MTTVHKSYPVQVLADGAKRTRARVSVYGNVDAQGDRVMAGAFRASLERWRRSGDPIPVIFSHAWGDPKMFVGRADPMFVRDDGAGLEVEIDWDDDATAMKVAQLVHDRRVKEWSFAYDVVDERPGEDRANELHVLDLIEIGPTLKGANPETVTLARKMLFPDAAPAKQATAKRTAPRQQKFLVGITDPRFGVFAPQYRYVDELAARVARIAYDFGDVALGEELRDIVLADGVGDVESLNRHLSSAIHSAVKARSQRTAWCPRCGKFQELALQDPVRDSSVVWAITDCGEILGWSALPTEQFVREMQKVRTFVDVGLVKHTERVANNASTACRDAAAVASAAVDQLGALNSQRNRLERIAVTLRDHADRLGAASTTDPFFAAVAGQAVQDAQAMLDVAVIAAAAGYADTADALVRAANRVIDLCAPLDPRAPEVQAGRAEAPKAADLSTGPRTIPQTNARFAEIRELAPVPTNDGETVSVPTVGVEPDHWTVERETT